MNHVISGGRKGPPVWPGPRPVCPRCAVPLDNLDWLSIRVDRCAACRGLWFDRGELRAVAASMGRRICARDSDLWREADRADFRGSDIDCPRCRSLMCRFRFGGSDVTVDYCVNCAGVWLDRDELMKLPQCEGSPRAPE